MCRHLVRLVDRMELLLIIASYGLLLTIGLWLRSSVLALRLNLFLTEMFPAIVPSDSDLSNAIGSAIRYDRAILASINAWI